MLDTYARKYFQPYIIKVANFFIKKGFSANDVTILSFVVGIVASLFIIIGWFPIAIILLWGSGLLDAVDGTIARETKKTSDLGALMDICFDRIVEVVFILCTASRFPNIRFQLIFLCASIIISMTIFLTVGALSAKTSKKSFYYQAGFAERTEGFIFFTLMLLLNNHISLITMVYAFAILFTASQRFLEAKRILK